MNIKAKKEPLRIVVFIISVAYIVFTWVKNDVVSIYTTMPNEQAAPLIATTIAVSLLKVGAISGVVFLVKWLIGKVGKSK